MKKKWSHAFTLTCGFRLLISSKNKKELKKAELLVCAHLCICMWVHICMFVLVHTCAHIWVHMHAVMPFFVLTYKGWWACVCMCVCVCVCFINGRYLIPRANAPTTCIKSSEIRMMKTKRVPVILMGTSNSSFHRSFEMFTRRFTKNQLVFPLLWRKWPVINRFFATMEWRRG